LIFGNVTVSQLWHDMAGHGGIVAYSARLVNIHTAEVFNFNQLQRGKA
jgi:hypothetical protein